MTNTDPKFIIKYEGKYYLTQSLWVYDESQGTAEQKAGASKVAAFFASAATDPGVSVLPPDSVIVLPPSLDNTEFGTAIHSVGTAIHPPGQGHV